MAFRNRDAFAYEPQPPSDGILPGAEMDREHIRKSVSGIKDNLLYFMGIDIDQAGFSRDEKGNLRLFEVTPDGEIGDPLESCPVVSGEFLEKIRQGRIFGFPAGEENPIQLQLAENGFRASRPIEDSPFPLPPEPTPWMRFANALFGAYNRKIGEFAASRVKGERCRAALEEIRKNRRDLLRDEEETFLAEEELRLGEERERKRRESVCARTASDAPDREAGDLPSEKGGSAYQTGRKD